MSGALRLAASLHAFPAIMTIDLDSRRSIRKISRADFAAYPVWEWAIDEEESHDHEESYLRPTSLDSLPAGLSRHYVVSATATLSEGSVLPACAEVHVRPKKVQIEPMFIFLQERQLPFGGQETVTVLSHYTKQAGTRPVSWALAVPIDGNAVPPTGQIRRGLLARLTQGFKRRGLASGRDAALVL